MFDKFMKDERASTGNDMIGKIVGVTFALYVVAYAAVDAILALVNKSGFAATSAIAPILQTLVPILVALGLGWMFYRHMSLR